ncbi:MAG: DUF484 family protein [Rhodospirillaceae bacterium]|jgi:uncharacterized protein|nr:DUF484 family protein [Rhodospirillaceae bacterium]MBT5193655.1 DUF484 family protein [Rhodospirillaceae bacterium]MBT5895235.1 DUF484 family protein [Rhodospirillaceae bacterium]MBT6430174.1 DUF484 family protein [Rhodospirillaceae bacterium]MBT7760533.1 DUF484 family protein [Rhodospirillaceae bacterium]
MASKRTSPELSRRERQREPSDGLAAEAVREYLLENPSFLCDNPDLLPLLRPEPEHNGENVLDMGQIVARRLGDEVHRLNAQHEELLAAGRANQAAQKQVHAAALAMMAARNFEHLIHIVTRDLAEALAVDTVTLCVEAAGDGPTKAPMGGVFVLPAGRVDAMLGVDVPARLEAVEGGDQLVFGPGAGLVRSQAIVRLAPSPGSPPGLLALGSRDEGKFHAGQGTELLQFLCRLLERLFRAWLDLPN